MRKILLIIIILYSFISLIMIKAYCQEDLKIYGKIRFRSFCYGLFFPITLIYQHYFNWGSLN